MNRFLMQEEQTDARQKLLRRSVASSAIVSGRWSKATEFCLTRCWPKT